MCMEPSGERLDRWEGGVVMPLFGRKRKPKTEKGDQGGTQPGGFVICPHCYVDLTVEQVREAGGVCPSCKGKIDLERQPRAHIK